jgi:hypothetical protein
MKKKIAALLLTAALITCTSQAAFAIENLPEPTEQSQIVVSPRYTNISRFSPSLSRTGAVSCVIQTSNCDYSLSVDLQQYIDGSWEDIDSWGEDGNSYGYFSASSSLERGQKYRIRAYVEVYGDSGDIIETATKYSSTVTA